MPFLSQIRNLISRIIPNAKISTPARPSVKPLKIEPLKPNIFSRIYSGLRSIFSREKIDSSQPITSVKDMSGLDVYLDDVDLNVKKLGDFSDREIWEAARKIGSDGSMSQDELYTAGKNLLENEGWK